MSANEEIRQEAKSSVKISTTAAGKPLPEVKTYEGTTGEEMARIRALAVETYRETLREVAA